MCVRLITNTDNYWFECGDQGTEYPYAYALAEGLRFSAALQDIFFTHTSLRVQRRHGVSLASTCCRDRSEVDIERDLLGSYQWGYRFKSHGPHVSRARVVVGAKLYQDCTHIVVKVVFPGCRMRDLEVDVTRRGFLAASPKL